MFVQIALMLVFCPVEILQGLDFHCYGSFYLTRHAVIYFLYRGQVLRIRIIDAGTVSCAFIVTLLVYASRIDGAEIELEYPFQPDYVCLIRNVHCLCISCGVSVDLTVCGVEDITVGIADLGGYYTVDQLKVTLGSPKAAGCEIDILSQF